MNYITINKVKYELFNDSLSDQVYIVQNNKKRPINQAFAYNAKRDEELRRLHEFRKFVETNFVDRTRFTNTRQNPYPPPNREVGLNFVKCNKLEVINFKTKQSQEKIEEKSICDAPPPFKIEEE
ncbi:uncharacterized protein LOC136087797 [Hydra vulgaris]|uniref:Uncharacterized protein LOC136087797 n=1 Tax=Hydra vulgaris TaxID=6087 RepID=A0ABM4CZJ3_HYDVU